MIAAAIDDHELVNNSSSDDTKIAVRRIAVKRNADFPIGMQR